MTATVAKATAATLCFMKIVHTFKFGLHNGYKHHLRDAFTYFNGKSALAAIPAGYKHLSLIVRVDQTYKISKHNPMFMP